MGNRMGPLAPTRSTLPQNKVATMGILENAERVQEEGNAAGVRFVLLELDAGLLFCRLASCSDFERDARRNEANAKRSYEAAIHYVKPLLLNRMERRTFDDKKERLSLLLVGATLDV
jgi:hypothetical protein